MSDSDHLQPGFDPKKLKIAQLRGLLLQYNVSRAPPSHVFSPLCLL